MESSLNQGSFLGPFFKGAYYLGNSNKDPNLENYQYGTSFL